jgi:hypothetical protein
VSSSPSINDIVKDYVVDVGRTLKVGGRGCRYPDYVVFNYVVRDTAPLTTIIR